MLWTFTTTVVRLAQSNFSTDVKEPASPACSDVRSASLPVHKMVGQAGLEPATPRLSSACSNQLSYRPVSKDGGGNRNRTDDILLAKQALYQLSYTPFQEGGLQ